ncbi:unnamed protein product [Durusdinium trenchii]|uniref:Uncharacterized protein n=1 Tax=Durusdinium trenchii TaxID=1381693 RepID=A0ABP0L1W8_9DINO
MGGAEFDEAMGEKGDGSNGGSSDKSDNSLEALLDGLIRVGVNANVSKKWSFHVRQDCFQAHWSAQLWRACLLPGLASAADRTRPSLHFVRACAPHLLGLGHFRFALDPADYNEVVLASKCGFEKKPRTFGCP